MKIDVVAPSFLSTTSALAQGVDSIFPFHGLLHLMDGLDWQLQAQSEKGNPKVTVIPHSHGEGIAPRVTEIPSRQLLASEPFLAYLACPRPLAASTKRGVFCGPTGPLSPIERQELRQLYVCLNKTFGPSLYMANLPEDLEGIAEPGPMTLFSPRAPDFHVRAIGSASWLVSYRPLPAIAAYGAGIPVLWVGEKESERSLARELGITFFLRSEISQEKLCGWLRKQTAGSNENVAPTEFIKWVGIAEAFLGQKLKLAQDSKEKGKGEISFASISNIEYLPFLEGFLANVIEAHPNQRVKAFILALDSKVAEPLSARFGEVCDLKTFELCELWSPTQITEIKKRSIGEQAFSSKPLLIREAIRLTAGPVFYADSDVYFFCNANSTMNSLAGNGALLFPHWGDSFSAARADGVFNAGMVLADSSGEPFLKWWSERCWENCNYGRNDGVVADQGYLDFSTALFDNIHSYRKGDHDVARWNLQSLGVYWDDTFPAKARLINGVAVGTYHAAFIDALGLFEVKCAWDGLVHFFSEGFSALKVPAPLYQLSIQQQARHWLSLSRWLALGTRFSIFPSFSHRWILLAVGVAGSRLLSLLASNRKVEWNSTSPRLPKSGDPWVLANLSHFQSINPSDSSATVSIKRPA